MTGKSWMLKTMWACDRLKTARACAVAIPSPASTPLLSPEAPSRRVCGRKNDGKQSIV